MANIAGPANFSGGMPTAQPAYLVDVNGNPLSSYPNNLTQIAGVPISNTNPFVTESTILNWTRMGYVFTVSTYGTTTTNPNLITCLMSLFNAANSSKNILIFSIQVMVGSGVVSSNNTIRDTTSDPGNTAGFTQQSTPVNARSGGGFAASVANVWCTATGTSASITPTGTARITYAASSNLMNELLTNGATIFLPNGLATGIEIVANIITASNAYGAVVKYAEF